jgi:hypothetical protein
MLLFVGEHHRHILKSVSQDPLCYCELSEMNRDWSKECTYVICTVEQTSVVRHRKETL